MRQRWHRGLKMIKTDMQRLRLGNKRYLVLVLLLLNISACRNSVPPKIEICLGDGVGGADCIEADGSKLYRTPSMLRNYWMTSEPDESNFSSWCYDTTNATVQAAMNATRKEMGR